MSKHAKSSAGMIHRLVLLPVFVLSFVYYECVFNLSTVKDLWQWGLPVMLLFSVAYGLVGYLLLSVFRRPLLHYLFSTVWMALGAFPFVAQYFVYRIFLVYYDITTMTGGAKDAAGSYSGLALEYIVSWDGALKIALFLLPTLLTAGIGVMMCVIRRCAYEQRPLVREHSSSVTMVLIRCLSAVMAVLCFCSGVLLTRSNDRAWAIYKTEYNYQLAVRHFGLLTGMRLDLKGLIGGHSKGDFEEVPSIEVLQPTTPSDPTDVPEKPIEYGYNQLELNLSGGSGEIKDLNAYVQSLTASKKNAFTGLFKDKNLIMITAEAFSAEVIDPELTPTLYRLATKGVQFKDYYQPASAGTTGGEYQNIFGMLPTASGASFKNTADHFNYMTMGSQLDRLGYYGKAYHNNSYTYYSRHLTHNNLGYSDGFMGYGNGMEKFVKNRWPQSDMEMFQGTLPTYIDKEKFNVYYMTVSGHNGYTQSGNSMTARNWDLVKDLPYSDQIKGYLAANLELEKALTYLVEELEKKGIADDTVICMTSDHFPYGLDDAGLAELYGSAPKNYFDRDHSAWILWCGSLEKEEPIVVSAPTSSLDILPTLSNLFGTEFDARLFPGRDVFSDAEAIVFNSNYDWKTEYGTYFASNGKFIPAEGVEVPEGYADRMKAIVRNKMRYCTMALNNDYFRYLFQE